MFHSWKGKRGLLWNIGDSRTLFQVNTISSFFLLIREFWLIKWCGEEGSDIAFCEFNCSRSYKGEFAPDASSCASEWKFSWVAKGKENWNQTWKSKMIGLTLSPGDCMWSWFLGSHESWCFTMIDTIWCRLRKHCSMSYW